MKCIKNYFGILLSTLLLMPLVASAENKLTFEPFEIIPGDTTELVIDMVNDKEITSVEFELELPDGLSIPLDDEDEYLISTTERASSSHLVSSNKNGNVYIVLINSQKNKNFTGNDGAVARVQILANNTFKSGTITVSNIELASANETAVYPDPISLVILPSVTVTIQNKERAYGAANPEFTYTTSEEIDLTGKVTFATEATATSNVGDYAITGTSTATDANVTFVNGTLTVTPAALTVTANAKDKVFGDDDPALTYETMGLVNGDQLTGSLTRDEGENVGTYAIKQGTLAASSNYTLTYNGANLTIAAKTVTEPVIEFAESTFTYSGAELKPAITVKDGETTIPAEEYTVAYDNNTNVGTATVTITDKADGNYTVSGSTTFTITAKSITSPFIELTTSAFVYDGTAKEPDVTVKDGTTVIPSSEYTVSYSDNTAAGTATVTIIDKDGGNYTVSGSTTFTITAKSITSPVIELATSAFVYDGTAKEPDVTVKDGTTVIPSSEYTVSYSNNTNAGTATVTITDKDGGNYTVSGSTTFTITKASLTVKSVDASREYGEEDSDFTVTYEGFINGDTKENAITTVPTVTTTATKTSPVGNDYVITVSGGEATNYELTGYFPATLTITPAPLTVKAKDTHRYVGEANPTFELEYTGFKNGETESVLTTKPVATTEATEASEVGQYDITVSGGEAQNYTFTYEKGTLTVADKSSITITATNVSRFYGDANPQLEYTVIGGNIEGTPQITCEAVASSPVGEYAIVVTKGSITTDANFTFHNGKLTVTKAPLTVTVKDATRYVGEANPTFELEYSGFKNGETESVLTVKPVATTEATADSPVGDYVITVSGGEDENYDFTYVNGTLTIAEKTVITITAKNATRKYGNANPTFEYTVSGGDITGTPELTCQATATSPVGEYTIKVVKGSITTDANFVFNDGALTVAKALLKVTAKDASREEGEENPTFELTYSGFKNGETESVLTVKPVATTPATTTTPAGMYPINVEGGEAQNYEFSYVSGTLTITEKEVIDGIATLSMEKVQGTVYTLSGQRVEKPRKGRLYIVNGRKVVLK